MRAIIPAILLAACCSSLFSQQNVAPGNLYERALCVVPLSGSGTPDDPKRPLHAPSRSARPSTSGSGILGFTHVLSDDGTLALVEFVARDRSAFNAILADSNAKCFVKGRDKREDAEAEFKKHKANFDFSHFGVGKP